MALPARQYPTDSAGEGIRDGEGILTPGKLTGGNTDGLAVITSDTPVLFRKNQIWLCGLKGAGWVRRWASGSSARARAFITGHAHHLLPSSSAYTPNDTGAVSLPVET